MKKLLNTLLLATGFSLVILPAVQAETIANDSTETTGQYIGSSAITTKVKSKFLTKKSLDSTDISVKSETATNDKTIVILTGCQKTQALVDLAGLTAKQVDGVTKVVNKLAVNANCGNKS